MSLGCQLWIRHAICRVEIRELTATATPVSLNLGMQMSLTICPSAPAIEAYREGICFQKSTDIMKPKIAKISTLDQASLIFFLITNKINMRTGLNEERIPISKRITSCKITIDSMHMSGHGNNLTTGIIKFSHVLELGKNLYK